MLAEYDRMCKSKAVLPKPKAAVPHADFKKKHAARITAASKSKRDAVSELQLQKLQKAAASTFFARESKFLTR